MKLPEPQGRAYRRLFFARLVGRRRRTVLEIDTADSLLLVDTLLDYAASYRAANVPAEDEHDLQADSEVLAHAHDLVRRILAPWA